MNHKNAGSQMEPDAVLAAWAWDEVADVGPASSGLINETHHVVGDAGVLAPLVVRPSRRRTVIVVQATKHRHGHACRCARSAAQLRRVSGAPPRTRAARSVDVGPLPACWTRLSPAVPGMPRCVVDALVASREVEYAPKHWATIEEPSGWRITGPGGSFSPPPRFVVAAVPGRSTSR